MTGLIDEIKAALVEDTIEYDEDNSFVAEEPYEWPNKDAKYDFDSYSDDDVVYEFNWADPGDGADIVQCYRQRVGKYTRFIIVTKESYPDKVAGIVPSALAMEVIFFNDKQIHGEIREYEYEAGDDGDSGSITVDIDTHVITFDMSKTAADDMHMDFDQLEHIGDSLVEGGI